MNIEQEKKPSISYAELNIDMETNTIGGLNNGYVINTLPHMSGGGTVYYTSNPTTIPDLEDKLYSQSLRISHLESQVEDLKNMIRILEPLVKRELELQSIREFINKEDV